MGKNNQSSMLHTIISLIGFQLALPTLRVRDYMAILYIDDVR